MTAQGSRISRRDDVPRIVFDFGGVLFDWKPLQLVRRFLPAHATDETTARALVASVFQGFDGDWAQFDRGVLDAADLVRRIVARTGLAAAGIARLVEGIPLTLTPKVETVDLLQRLHAAGASLHFLSNMPAPYAEHLDRTHPELIGCFDSGLYSSRARLIKPEAAFFELASRHFAAPPDRLVLLDDIAANVGAARALGWKALHFSDAAGVERALRAHGWWPPD
ncbi:MAG TPA: HAD family phosphatase [Burkholderiaceae bacterium]|nr:HAD family phosphatase [Burkholderiaceae bacterium]